MEKQLKLENQVDNIAKSLGVSRNFLIYNLYYYNNDVIRKVTYLLDYIDQLSVTTKKKPHLRIV